MKLVNVGIKELDTTVSMAIDATTNRSSTSPAEITLGSFLAKKFVPGVKRRCKSSDRNTMNARLGMNQKVDIIIVKTTASSMDVR